MLLILSPSKTQDFETPAPHGLKASAPALLRESEILVKELRRLSAPKLERLMEISPKLAALNAARYQAFRTPFTQENARPALFAFQGDVYDGLQADIFSSADCKFADAHLRILSGLYGCLKPSDLIQPYRLEMKTKLKGSHGSDLYAFWGDRITAFLNESFAASGSNILINLASEEYFKAVNLKKLEGIIITPQFKEIKAGKPVTVALFAKRARGLMAHYAIKNRIATPEGLKDFGAEGYRFSKDLSDFSHYVFTRLTPQPKKR